MAYTDIDKPDLYFNTLLRNGTGSSVTAITGVGFQPDWIWQKRRDDTSDHHLTDSVRGATKLLYSSSTSAEQTNSGFVQSIDSDGFTMGANDWPTSATVVAWNWLAGGTASSNTDGSITSTVSANTTSGFSIVSYAGNSTSGATIGHGLGTAPSLIIIKSRTSSYNWAVYHSAVGSTKYLRLNSTISATTSSTRWNDTTPTSSVFTLGNAVEVNESGGNYIAYCFAEKKGFSKFGSYVGNGNNDGPFCFTGFKPALVIKKRAEFGADYRGNWQIHDNKRGEYFPGNVVNNRIDHTNNAESGGDDLGFDFLSNGFKVRTGNVNYNPSGEKVIYIAFAESPFVTSTGIPTTAK